MTIFRALYASYCILSFILLFLIFFPFFLLFGILGYRKTIWYIIRFWSILWFGIIGMSTHTKYVNPQVFSRKQKGTIIVANHQSYLDVPLIFRAIPIMCRPLAKYELAKVPLFGYLYRQMAVMVDRSNPVSKRKSIMDLKKVVGKGEHIFIFPEGTFNETAKTFIPFYDGAFKIALDTQTNIVPVLFLDTARRFHYSGIFNWTPGRNRVIILEEIDISQYTQGDVKRLKKDVFNIMSRAMHQEQPHLEKVLMK